MNSSHRVPDLIALKRDGDELSEEQITHFIQGVVQKKIADSQIGAMLMAIFLKGLNRQETVHLTKAMIGSGETLQWPEDWKNILADKHSTGGVGDKVSLPLAPALVACGIKVPMISGRGLGFTGGTLDKLESIPGFRVDLTPKEMLQILSTVGCCIVGQTDTLVPADRTLYSIRDVTGTVASMPLIVSSIISKKAAENISGLVLDVKCGKGAFVSNEEDAFILAQLLVSTTKGLGIRSAALITDMNSPIGKTVGNSVEVAEAIECLCGQGPPDLEELVCEQGGELLFLLDKVVTVEDGKALIKATLHNGKARQVFCNMLTAQGVEQQVANKLCSTGSNPFDVLPRAQQKKDVLATKGGIITAIDPLEVAKVSRELGAGRSQPGEKIDLSVGLVLDVRVGQYVSEGATWMTVYHKGNFTTHQEARLQEAIQIEASDVTDGVPAKSRIIRVVDKTRHPSIFACQ